MERHLTTLELSYKYTDVTSNPDYPITYEVKGSMTMERQINPLIPDEIKLLNGKRKLKRKETST